MFQTIATNSTSTTSIPQVTQSKKPPKTTSSVTGRPRGRPRNVNQHLQSLQHDSMSNQFNSKGAYSNYHNSTTSGNRSLMNPFCLNPLLDPTMLAAMLSSGVGGGVMDPYFAMNYLNQMGNYQDIFRQYQSNISSITNLATSLSNTSSSSNVTNMNNASTMSTTTSNNSNITTTPNVNQFANINNHSNLTVKQKINLANNSATTRSSPLYQQSSTTTTTTSSIKERPDISITPVGSSSYKQKFPSNSNFPQTSKTSQMSLLKNSPTTLSIPSSSIPPPIPPVKSFSTPVKPISKSNTTKSIPPIKSSSTPPKPPPVSKSIIPPVKSLPPSTKQSPQMRVTNPQPAHNSSQYTSLKGNNTVVTPSMLTLPSSSSSSTSASTQQNRAGNTLQHKLQSKKQSSVMNPVKKSQKSTTNFPQLSNYHHHHLHTQFSSSPSQHSYLPSELSVSVNPVGKFPTSKSPIFRKQKSQELSTTTNLSQSKVNETLTALSQLQQQNSIEIIPQQKNLDFAKNLTKSLNGMPQGMPENLKSSGDLSVFEITKKSANPTTNNNSNKRNEKTATKESVEIITLDD